MDPRSLDEQVKSGFLLAGKTILVILTAGALTYGIYGLRKPDEVVTGSFAAGHPSLPLICLIVATAILISTINRWVTILPGIFGYSTIGGLIMLTTGQYNRVKVPWPVALVLTIFCIASSYVTSKFADRPLTLTHRVALLAFTFCIAFGMTSKNNAAEVLTWWGIGLAFVLAAWMVDLAKASNEVVNLGANTSHL